MVSRLCVPIGALPGVSVIFPHGTGRFVILYPYAFNQHRVNLPLQGVFESNRNEWAPYGSGSTQSTVDIVHLRGHTPLVNCLQPDSMSLPLVIEAVNR